MVCACLCGEFARIKLRTPSTAPGPSAATAARGSFSFFSGRDLLNKFCACYVLEHADYMPGRRTSTVLQNENKHLGKFDRRKVEARDVDAQILRASFQ